MSYQLGPSSHMGIYHWILMSVNDILANFLPGDGLDIERGPEVTTICGSESCGMYNAEGFRNLEIAQVRLVCNCTWLGVGR